MRIEAITVQLRVQKYQNTGTVRDSPNAGRPRVPPYIGKIIQ